MQEKSFDKDDLLNFIKKVVDDAISNHASDIHFEHVDSNRARIRFRIDGILRPQHEIRAERLKPALAMLQGMSGSRPSHSNAPHQFSIKLDEQIQRGMSLTCASVPTGGGRNDFSVRIVPTRTELSLSNLRLLPSDQKSLEESLKSTPFGITIVSGPTASGKGIVSEALLTHLAIDAKAWRICEDELAAAPSSTHWSEVELAGNSFNVLLATLARMDPDVIDVGSFKGPEKIAASVDLALAGVHIIAQMHANSAADATIRYLDFGHGVYPRLMIDALKRVVCSRLVRRLCSECRQKIPLDENAVRRLLQAYHAPPERPSTGIDGEIARFTYKRWLAEHGEGHTLHLYEPRGCDACAGTGYRGRVAIIETIRFSKKMRALLLTSPQEQQIMELAQTEGATSFRQNGIERALVGDVAMAALDAVLS